MLNLFEPVQTDGGIFDGSWRRWRAGRGMAFPAAASTTTTTTTSATTTTRKTRRFRRRMFERWRTTSAARSRTEKNKVWKYFAENSHQGKIRLSKFKRKCWKSQRLLKERSPDVCEVLMLRKNIQNAFYEKTTNWSFDRLKLSSLIILFGMWNENCRVYIYAKNSAVLNGLFEKNICSKTFKTSRLH